MYILEKQGSVNNNVEIPVHYKNTPIINKESFTLSGSEANTKNSSSNKVILYIALAIAIIVALGGGYIIYKHYTSEKKVKESFGYKL